MKVYRNVQAVVAEGNEKDLKLMEQLTGDVKNGNKKTNLILGVSVGALIISLGGLVLQLIAMF